MNPSYTRQGERERNTVAYKKKMETAHGDVKIMNKTDIKELNKRLTSQKGIKVDFQIIPEANHFFTKSSDDLIKTLDKYIKKETTLF